MPALEGRRLWFVGIGGAGLSAYAQLARAWGAEVGGWDRVHTPYLDRLAGSEIEIGPEPVLRAGYEAVVSSAYPTVPGLRRARFLAELVALRRSIVVGGTHGKGTTAAMIAFALAEAGGDPAWLIGAPVPQLGSNAGAGEGWLVVEGDESDRTVFSLPAEIAVVTNVELDHHSEYHSLAELAAEFDRWAEAAPHAVRDAPPFTGKLLLPGEHNRQNAGAALAALELAGVAGDEAAAALGRFGGTGRRFEVSEVAGVTNVDDYAHHTRARSRRRSPPPARPTRAAASASSFSRTWSRAHGTSPATSARPWPAPTTSSSPTSTSPARRRIPTSPAGSSSTPSPTPAGCPAGSRGSSRPPGTWRRVPGPATCCSCSEQATSTPRRRC